VGANHWTAVTEDEFVAQYRARFPNAAKKKTEAEIRADYQAGKRIDPEGSLKDVRGSAVYGTAQDAFSGDALPSSGSTALTANGRPVTFADLRQKLDAAQQRYEIARKNYDEAKTQGLPKSQIDALRTQLNNASRDLGELGAEAYVASRYPGPPPPELLYPPDGATSRSGDFDRVYRVADGYGHTRIVVEAKGNSAQLQDRQVAKGERADQGTATYLDSVIEEMRTNKNPDLKRVGRELHLHRMGSSIDYLEVRTTAGRPPTVVGREFDLTTHTGTHP
jgi:hypothetical protein